MKTDGGEVIENLTVADASVFPAGCEINPQLTIKALASLAASRLSQRMTPLESPSINAGVHAQRADANSVLMMHRPH